MINADKEKRILRSVFIQLALRNHGPFFALPLAQYANKRGLAWLDLPSSFCTKRDSIDKLACCFLPKAPFFERDVLLLSKHVGLPCDLIRRLAGAGEFGHSPK